MHNSTSIYSASGGGVTEVTGVVSSDHRYDISNFLGSIVQENIRLRFLILSEQWKRDIRGISSSSDIIKNYSYQKIMAMGRVVVPLIFEDLKKNRNAPLLWFPALRAILDNGPEIPKLVRSDRSKIAEIWIAWAEENNVIS